MSKTTDKKIKELSKKHSTDEKVKYDCTAWDEGQVFCTEKDWFKSWLQQALSEVERESYERGKSDVLSNFYTDDDGDTWHNDQLKGELK